MRCVGLALGGLGSSFAPVVAPQGLNGLVGRLTMVYWVELASVGGLKRK